VALPTRHQLSRQFFIAAAPGTVLETKRKGQSTNIQRNSAGDGEDCDSEKVTKTSFADLLVY
jgi:hypothetical protein